MTHPNKRFNRPPFHWAGTLVRTGGRLAATLNCLIQDRQGNFAILTALLSVVLIGAAGGAIDVSRAIGVKTDLQAELDAIVLAAVHEPSSNRIARAQKLFAGITLPTTENAPEATFEMDAGGALTGTASVSVKTSLMAVMSVEKIQVSATSTATAARATGAPCIILLDQGRDPLYVNSGAGINKTDCEIHVHSSAYSAATFTDGGNGLKVHRICIRGGTVSYNNQLNKSVELNCQPAADPYAKALPLVNNLVCDPTLGGHLPDNKQKHTLSPGVYCGKLDANGSPTIELKPGLYVIKAGEWFFNSGTTLIGKGVTIYLADTSSMHFNGNVNIDLSAPTSGTYKNILLYEAQDLPASNWIFDGNKQATLDGIIYLPSRNIHFNSNFAMNNNRAAIVLNRMSLDGTSWNLTPLNGIGGQAAAAVRLLN